MNIDDATPPETPSDAAMRVAAEILKLTHSQDIDGGTKRITTAIAAIITRYLGATQPHCWHCGVLLEEVESKPRCDQCPADCDDETCSAFGCAPSATATTLPSETAAGGEARRDRAVFDAGFTAPVPAAGDDEGDS